MRALQLGTDLTLVDKPTTAELDIYGVHKGQIIAGEVKTDPTRFTHEQIERDVRLSERLGARTHLMAAIGTIDDAKRHFAERAAQIAHIGLLVLDARDLRPAASRRHVRRRPPTR